MAVKYSMTVQLRAVLWILICIFCIYVQQSISDGSRQELPECELAEPDLIEDFNKVLDELGTTLSKFQSELNNISFKRINDSDPIEGIILIGNTGAGKSTLAQLLSGDNSRLISKEVNPNSADYIVTDGDKIGTETIISKTLHPNMVIDNETGIIVCDSPGFKDTRSPIHELIAASSMISALERMDDIKIVLVINHASLRTGGYRDDFTNLLKQTIDFVKDINKYKNSIYIVATKTENSFVYKGGKPTLTTDKTIVSGIKRFLNETRSNLKSHLSQINGEKVPEMIKLIDSLMASNGEGVPLKIKIFRKPLTEGPLQNIEFIQNERKDLRAMLFKKENFTKKDDDDFGHSISSGAHLYVNEIFSLADKFMIAVTKQISKYFLEYYRNRLENAGDAGKRLNILVEIKPEMIRLGSEIGKVRRPLDYVQQIEEYSRAKNITFGCDFNFKNLSILNEQLIYLKKFSNVTDNVANTWNSSLKSVIDYVEADTENNRLLIEVFSLLSSYDFQAKKGSVIPIIDQWEADDPLHNAINDMSFVPFLKILKLDTRFNGIKVTDYTLEMLNRASYLLVKSEITISCVEETVRVEGYIIKLSDIDYGRIKACGKFKNVEFYAMHTLFVDRDLDDEEFLGRQMVMIARTWHVVGTRRISVDGRSVNNYMGKADTGEVGRKGENGGNGGIFLGIGETFENAGDLVISANGGNGQDGQDGGDGRAGFDGRDGVYYSRRLSGQDKSIYVVYNKVREYEYYEGSWGGAGGDSGAGGTGGLGGRKGSARLVGFGRESSGSGNADRVSIHASNGYSGKDGDDGVPGLGGIGGCDKIYTRTEKYALFIPVSSSSDISYGSCKGRSESGRIIYRHHYFHRPSFTSLTLNPIDECHLILNYTSIYEHDYKSAQYDQIVANFIQLLPCH